MSGITKKLSYFKTARRVMSMEFKATPFIRTANIIMGIAHSIVWVFMITATQLLFDAIFKVASGSAGFQDCVIPLLIISLTAIFQQIINGLYIFSHRVIYGKSVGLMSMSMYKKLQLIDPVNFEDTNTLDDFNKAKEAIQSIPYFCMCNFMFLSHHPVYILSVGAYLFWLQPVLMLNLLVAFLPALIAQVVRTRVFTQLEDENAPLRREFDYYQKTLCDREYFKETRMLGAFRIFHKLFSDTVLLLTKLTWRAERKTALIELMLSAVTFSGMAVTVYMLFKATFAGDISIGAFVAIFIGLQSIFSILQEIFSYQVSYLSKDVGKISHFVRILDMPERYMPERKRVDQKPTSNCGIVAKNVSFTYPGKIVPAVTDISLAIHKGETIAIVGENGAGKSTLVRLLTGIYHPMKGKVTVFGQDTLNSAPASIYNKVSGVFQKYQRYKMTLEENVTISDTTVKVDKARLERVLKQADTDPELKHDDMLSPEFDGVDLSGGQWQRVAIARGLYRDNDFIVLDEPTSAIDPIEETRVYKQFQHLAKEKYAIVVTHRLGSAKLANRIVVMDSGKIVDEGKHSELIARPGKYYDMWTAQAQWYER